MRITEIDYKFLRSTIFDGMIGGFRSPTTFGWAIRLWTKGRGIDINGEPTEINHVGTFHWDRTELFILEAVGKKVQMNRFSESYNYKKYKGDIYLLDPCFETEADRWRKIDRILPHIGKPYNVQDIIKQAFGEEELSNIDKSFYCSALENYSLDFALTNGKPLNIKPQEILTRLIEKNGFKQTVKYKIKRIGM